MNTFIIAEAGSNHLNDADKVDQLIQSAAYAGCNAVKFQLFDVDRIWISKDAADRRRQFEMPFDLVIYAAQACEDYGLEFMCSPFSPDAVRALRPYVQRWKVASAHIGDRELMDAICEDQKPVLVSTGAVNPMIVRDRIALWTLHGHGTRTVIPLICVSKYPAEARDYGLNTWLARSGVRAMSHGWGISDHTIGVGTSIAAVTLGASYVEKHIKLADQPKSPDDGPHACTPPQLCMLTAGIKQAEAAIMGGVAAPKFPPGRRVWR